MGELSRMFDELEKADDRFDEAVKALSARDYDLFDRIMEKRAYAPKEVA